jgi:hypothetical protein
MPSMQHQQLLNTATTNPTNREAIAFTVQSNAIALSDSKSQVKGITLHYVRQANHLNQPIHKQKRRLGQCDCDRWL